MFLRKSIIVLLLSGWIFNSLSATPLTDRSVIKGRVTDSDGKALYGAVVAIENSFLGVHSDINGNYLLSGLKDGTYKLRFSFIGYETIIKEISLTGELTLNVNLAARTFITDEVLISATRAGEHSPLAYSTVSNEYLRSQNIGQDMPYLLSLTPSLVETSEAGNGIGYTNLRIRGTDGNRINVTIDDIPLNDPESQQVFWVDLPDLASSVENIQVQRGAGTSSNGAGAFGATISINTSNPENEPFAEAGSSIGSFNSIKNTVSAGTGLLSGKFAIRMRYSEIKSDGYIDRTGSNHRSAFISGIYRTERSRLKANIILGEEHTGIGWWGVPKDSLATNRRYNPSGQFTDESGMVRYYNNESDNYIQDHFQLIYNLKMNGFLTLNTALHYTKGKGYYEEYGDNQSLADYGIQPFPSGDSIISQSDLIRRKWMSNDFYGLVYSLKYKKERIEAVTGGGMNLYAGDHFGNIIWMRNAGDTEIDHQWYFNRSRKGEISLYGKVNFSLSEKLSIYGDLQYRSILYKIKGIEDDLMDVSQEHKFGFINPKAGLFYSITPNQDSYFSLSIAHREPTRSDFTEATGDLNATPKSELLYDYEMGYKLRTGKSSMGLNLYAMIYHDQLVPTGELSNVGYSIMTNVEKSFRLGAEISTAIRLSENINWIMNMTLSENKIKDFVEHYIDYLSSDGSANYLSKNLGTVDIAYSPSTIWTNNLIFRFTKWSAINLISKYVGKQYFDNTMSGERTISPYFVNSLRLDLTPEINNMKEVELQFLVNNILNEVYENNAYGGNWYENGSEKSWSYFFPQAGINYMCKISLKF